jgi:hypothetical protein
MESTSMGEPIVRATHGSPEKPLRIGTTIAIPCYVLEDGRRVLAHAGMLTALDMGAGGIGNAGSYRLANFITSKRLSPFIPSPLARSILQPILFRAPRAGRFAYGYEATVLADLCDAILEARKWGRLEERQRHIAERAEVLVRAFARVGIIALVDEVTGYQADRDRGALHKILAAYVSPELLPWAKRFPDEFYQHMFRLRGWTFDPQHGPRGPRLAGLLTVQLVYDKLPPHVLDELRRKNPVMHHGRRRHRHHQFLTKEIGNVHLDRHLPAVIALMRVATTWEDLERLMMKAFPARTIPDTLPLPLGE